MAEIKYMWNFFKGLYAWNLESDKKLECMEGSGHLWSTICKGATGFDTSDHIKFRI